MPPSPEDPLGRTEDRILAAMRGMLRSSHLAGPSDLPRMVETAGSRLGARLSRLYLADYDQVLLVPLTVSPAGEPDAPAPDDPGPILIDGTLAGLAYSDIAQHAASPVGGTVTLWTPVLDGTERLGVLELDLPEDEAADHDVREGVMDVAALIAEMVITRSMYGDAVEHARRTSHHTVEAELQWRLLPPLTFVSPELSVAGVVAPAHEVAGDSFDYAINGSVAHVAVLDGMGHGLEATLLAAVAVSWMRKSRMAGLDLEATVRAVDAGIAAHFGPAKFLTGIIGELDVATGWWRWITCGHPPALLLRGGKVVKQLDAVVGAPLGLELLGDEPLMGQEHLEPGDRLVLYTDGVVEARDEEGRFFGTDRLVEFATREAAHSRPVAETLRRLNHAVLRHQEGELQDDATTVVIEWRTDPALVDMAEPTVED